MQTRHLLCSLFLLPVSLFAADIDPSGTYSSEFDPRAEDGTEMIELKVSALSDQEQSVKVRSYDYASLDAPDIMEQAALQTDGVPLCCQGIEENTLGTLQFQVTEAESIL